MDENIKQIIAHHMDELFEQEVSLRTMVGNDSARAILQVYVDEFFNNKIAGLNPHISPILLVGGKEVHVMARTISNTLAYLVHHTISAKWLNDGVINLHAFLSEGSEFSAYYIDGDKLNSNNQLQLSKILKEKKIVYYDFESKSWQKKIFDRLIILSTSNKNDIPHILLNQFKIQVNVMKLTPIQIELALRQRLSLLNIRTSSEELVGKIAQCCSDISQAMAVLVFSHTIMRANNAETLMEKHVNVALHLLDKNMKAAGQKSVG